MRTSISAAAASLLLGLVLSASAQQAASPGALAASAPDVQTAQAPGSADAPVAPAQRVIESVMAKLQDKSPAKNALAVLKELIDDTRSAQARVYSAARTINRNLDAVRDTDSETVAQARKLTRKLMVGSYSDALFQSRNLGDQIKTRLANLVADSLLLQTDSSPLLRQDFLAELEMLTKRFVDARRFRAGIGAEYIYMPKVSYAAAANIDLTPFQSSGAPVGGNTGFVVDFGNQSTPATRIVASGSGMEVAVALPSDGQSREFVTSVQHAAVSGTESSPDLLYRTTLTSRLKPEFDASLSFSLLYALNLIRDKPEEERERDRISYHLGIGMTGFRIDESSTTDVRQRSNPAQTFNDLSTTGTTVSSRRISFKSAYWNADARFVVSDESQLGLSYRRYFGRKSEDETSPRVSGYALSIYFVWLPTFGW